MMGIAKALQYLHSERIIFTDLKPQNVGFTSDESDTVKLFDFGLARRVQEGIQDKEAIEDSREIVGSIRYQAPECLTGTTSCNFSSDVYSFGVLFYEVATLEQPYCELVAETNLNFPFRGATIEDFRHAFAVKLSRKEDGGQEWRHPLNNISCSKTSGLIHDCWDPHPSNRPTFEQICSRLEEICIESKTRQEFTSSKPKRSLRFWPFGGTGRTSFTEDTTSSISSSKRYTAANTVATTTTDTSFCEP
jgi:serine/threonine protein kinase